MAASQYRDAGEIGAFRDDIYEVVITIFLVVTFVAAILESLRPGMDMHDRKHESL